MALLQPKDEQTLRERFQRELIDPVSIVLYTQTLNCPTCPDAEAIAREVTDLSDKIELVMKNPAIDREDSSAIQTDLLPAWRFETENIRPNVIYYGLPAGYEFSVLIETIIAVSRNQPKLEPSIIEKTRSLTEPVDIKVFVTPTCPYCPQMAFLAFQMAQINPNITANVIEASEFPAFSSRYQVRAVPRTVINDRFFFDGALPPEMLIEQLIELQNQKDSEKTAESSPSQSGSGLIIVP